MRSFPGRHRKSSDVVLLGAGTAMVYPTLLAASGDVAHPEWRGRSVGIYRLWLKTGVRRFGALLSGIIVAVRMRSSDHCGQE